MHIVQSAVDVLLLCLSVCNVYYVYTGWAKNGTIYCTPHNFTKY